MNTEDVRHDVHSLQESAAHQFSQHRFLILIALAVVIGLTMTGIGLALYTTSGAAQLDLSRPGYSDVRSQAITEQPFDDFSNTGPIDESALAEFRALYEPQLDEAIEVNAYSGDVLSNSALKIE